MKKVLSMLLLLTTLLSLCACDIGKPGTEPETTLGTEQPAPTEDSTEPVSEPSTEAPTEAPLPNSEGLLYEINEDGASYTVTGIGTCTDAIIVIPGTYNGYSVTAIGSFAFSSCKSITAAIVPGSVTDIGNYAFTRCSNLTSITLSEGLISIGNAAFSGCHSMESINIPKTVTGIGNGAFSDCNQITSIILPDGVSDIAQMVFAGCHSLKSVKISSHVSSIHELAFYYCYSLTDIYFDGTYAQWKNISKDNAWDDSAPDCTIHCTDGDFSK